MVDSRFISEGVARTYAGQTYVAMEVVPHICRTGRESQLVTWRGAAVGRFDR